MEAPLSPRWVSEEWRSWWSVPPAGGFFEYGGGAFVGQSSPPSKGAFVTPGRNDVGPTVSEKDWTTTPTAQIAGQETSCARSPEYVFLVVALAGDHRSFAGQVHVLNVECQDFPSPSGGFVQHPPQGLLPEVYVSS